MNNTIKLIIEAALFAADEPLSTTRLHKLFSEEQGVSTQLIQLTLATLQAEYADRGIVLCHVASGWRYQVRSDLTPQLQVLWEKKPPRYSRSCLETLALIAYRQPITRGEIEAIRGVPVASHLIKTLQEHLESYTLAQPKLNVHKPRVKKE